MSDKSIFGYVHQICNLCLKSFNGYSGHMCDDFPFYRRDAIPIVFKWKELDGKILEISVGEDLETGNLLIGGKCQKTGVVYVLEEVKNSPTKEEI